jgi:hypothetical protein
MPRLVLCLSALAVAASSPALAQVGAADIWSEWQAASAAAGQEMTADVTETANGLVLENFTTRLVQEDVTSVGRLDRVTLTEEGDGTLSVALSDPYTLSLTFPEDDDGSLVTMEILLSHEALDISVAGPPEARSYTYAADAITVSEGAISNDAGQPVPSIDMQVVARDLATTYGLIGLSGEDQRFESEGTVGSVAGRFDVIPPDPEEGQFKASFAFGEMRSDAEGMVVALTTIQQTTLDGLPPGFEIEASSDYAWSRFDISFDSPDETFDMSYSNEGGAFGFAFSGSSLRYDIAAEGMQTRISGSEIPMPVEVSASSSELSLTVPLAASATPSEAAIRLAWRDLAASEEAWAMIDPTGQVPRNPVTLVFDATAQVQLMKDLMNPETMEMEEPPGELRALTVSELELTFGDTSLTGTADMTFAPGQPMPQPVGGASLELVGGNALLEQLQAAGLITAEQAGMARGVAGMFSRPGAAPDTLETTIEFMEDGTVTANGVPLQ